MNTLQGLLLFAAILSVGCGTTRNVAETSYHVTRDVAVGSYRVATAPVHYVLKGHSGPKMVGEASDVTQPGQPVSSQQTASPPQRQPKVQSESAQTSTRASSHLVKSDATQPQPKPSSASQSSYPQADFPTAKAVPDKPGYVFSPFDSSGRYVDVSGYASGTKVKDPWTDKIFLVP
jgi:hypothetical protein